MNAEPYPGMLHQGSNGPGVIILQDRLAKFLLEGYGGTLAVDGAFGRRTDQAVRWYQVTRHNQPFNLTIDGLVGMATWGSLWR